MPSIVLLITLAFTLLVNAQDRDFYKTVATHEPVSFKLEGGTLDLTDLRIREYGGSLSPFDGLVTNNSDRDWKNLVFLVTAYDNTGAEQDVREIRVEILRKGETLKLSTELVSVNYHVARFSVALKSSIYVPQYRLAMLKPGESKDLVFEDSDLQISFSVSAAGMAFVLYNKTDAPIKVDWNQVSYIDTDSESHRVIHRGVRLIQRDESQAPSIIPPAAKLSDFILPSDYFSYSSLKTEWIQRPLLPDGPASREYKDRSIGVFLPLGVKGATKNYSFVFKIQSVE
ncbi:MAG: hypothetical protein ACREBG_28480 [Pyrinomonadaceae bacterium]